MPGLLNRVAKQLLGSQKTVSQKTASNETVSVKMKPAERPAANAWVQNSTILNPMSSETSTSERNILEKNLSKENILEENILERNVTEQNIFEQKISEAIASNTNNFESRIEDVNVPETVDRTVKRERTKIDVEKEDYLLTQIDEFREKAQHLQDLLLSKESKVLELQNIVDEREIKAQELEYILNERQRKADGISAEVSQQIDKLIEKVSAKMEEIGSSIGADLENGQKMSAEQLAELKETLQSITEQLNTIKGELSEKVHSENVKCYRNVADLFKSMDDKMDAVKNDHQAVAQKVNTLHKCSVAIIVLSILNMLGLAVMVILQFVM